MKSRWDQSYADSLKGDLLLERVYTSRLLGQETDLVLHGGGNTSVKANIKNFFGDLEEVLYIKGSGWDLSTIESAGFAPVRLSVLQRLAELTSLSDSEMVREQRAAMLDPYAPNPSVEAILHAIIPYRFVDHTHADAVVTLTNNPTGLARVKEVYGEQVLIIPYVMPGFILAREIRNLTKDVDWHKYQGMILMNHGIFSFADDAKTAYERMIHLVTLAEEYLVKQNAVQFAEATGQTDLLTLSKIRKAVSQVKGTAMITQLDQRTESVGFANLPNIREIATRGPVTPDHVIRTKPIPVILPSDQQGDVTQAVNQYAENYHQYFLRNNAGDLKELDLAPRWGVWPGYGTLSFDQTLSSAQIITDIIEHTRRAIQMGEKLGGWQPISEKDLFEMEYWELEQAKLGKGGNTPELRGKIAVVTGAASGIGKACVEVLAKQGAVVVGLDMNPAIREIFNKPGLVGIEANILDEKAVQEAIALTVQKFGGLDILVSNAGIFPASETIENLSQDTWEKSLNVNLSSQRSLLQAAIPFLKQGIDPTIIFIGSRNVLAPGPGAAAYSVAKAGLTQLARVAALELAADGIRVNTIHPDCVYDTGIWTADILASRAERYGLTVDEYKSRNLLKQPVTSQEVAQMVAAMAGKLFGKTTGCQLPIDGGNERVI
jgi:rhamnose utilization protein RhaD (predicted bifunctional aldolase and dehydrogenase)/NAD(P)-dependent dehydrogenase (short-subunit alcohol dehydrogenase family)